MHIMNKEENMNKAQETQKAEPKKTKESYITNVYEDSFGRGKMITVSYPYFVKDEFKGVVDLILEVYKELNLNDFQKKNYDKILLDFTERQKEINIRQEQNFKKLHKATSDPNATNEEIDKLKNEQIDIISNKISTPVDYIQNIRKILNKDQLLIFCSIIEKKEIYKIMPPPIKKRPKRKKLEDFRKNN